MTSFEDRTLVCCQCHTEFVFTKGEQEFFAQRGLSSEPKRCKKCRDARKKQRRPKGDGVYRSPAFENSAPSHQKIRGGGNFRRKNDYRSPGLNEHRSKPNEYRSPAFRDIDVLKPDEEYRAPGFREFDAVDPKEEYRAPGFSELADMNIREEYRAPGFQDMAGKYKDEKPLFSIVCASCGQEAMIPFLPEEGRPAYCKACYAAEKERRREEAEAARAAAEAEAPAELNGETAETETAAAVSDDSKPAVSEES